MTGGHAVLDHKQVKGSLKIGSDPHHDVRYFLSAHSLTVSEAYEGVGQTDFGKEKSIKRPPSHISTLHHHIAPPQLLTRGGVGKILSTNKGAAYGRGLAWKCVSVCLRTARSRVEKDQAI